MSVGTHADHTNNASGAKLLSRTLKAISLLSIDSKNLRGAVIKGCAGPIREALFGCLQRVFMESNFQKIYPTVSDATLFGGIDFARTVNTGKVVRTRGFLNSSDSVILLSMADLLDATLIGKYAATIDNSQNLCFIASDESPEGETIASAFLERVAFSLTTDGIHYSYNKDINFDDARIKTAKKKLSSIPITDDVINSLTVAAKQLGISSLRAPILACYTARALASFHGNDKINEKDVLEAAGLVLSHRATVIPVEEQPDNQENNASSSTDGPKNDDSETLETMVPLELLLDTLRSNIPPEALKLLKDTKRPTSKTQTGSGVGRKKKSNRRGRPMPSKPGRSSNDNRIDIIETIKAAAPWQTIRKKTVIPRDFKILVRAADIRIKRYDEKSDRLVIFAVDASGTAALGRLGETKGAIEILLTEAYAQRDHVALISFRQEKAVLELPPTRSLVQTKRRLTGLPGGGATPLAGALLESYKLVDRARSRGMTPTLVLLTDGKGNIALDGSPNRTTAQLDLTNLGNKFKSDNIPVLVIDTSTRPQIAAKDLSKNLNANYLALPYADAKRLYSAISSTMV